MANAGELTGWLRAAGEPTRLRLLVLCADRELSVGALALAVAQSTPRVSRHLKILCDAGLLRRIRHGQWVHYGLAASAPSAAFLRALLAQVDAGEVQLARDRRRLDDAASTSAAPTTGGSRLGRSLCAFIDATRAGTPRGRTLLIGLEHPVLLTCAATLGTQCTAVAHSRHAAQAARALVERAGLAAHIEVARGDAQPTGAPFDAVIVDRVAGERGNLPEALAAVRASVRPEGRIWLFERYESLESNSRVVEHPLARLRRLLGEAGFACRNISPIEADGEHVLAALALAGTASAASAA